jgi:hypothetical protein
MEHVGRQQLSAYFRESSERLKEELGSLSRSLEHLQSLPRNALLSPAETGVDTVEGDAAPAWPTQPAAPTPGRYTDATAPGPPGSAERLHFTQRSHQLEHVLKERDARIQELALELEGVREEEDARTADLRRLLDLPSDGQELTASVASALLALRSNHEAKLMAVRLEADNLARELRRAQAELAQSHQRCAVAEGKLMDEAAHHESALRQLEERHSGVEEECRSLLRQAQGRIQELEGDNHRTLMVLHQHAAMHDAEATMQRLFATLGVRDADELASTYAKLQVMMSGVPALQAFVRDVCDIVASGSASVDGAAALRSAHDVPAHLRRWLANLHELSALQAFRDAVAIALARRPGANSLRHASDALLVAAIGDGVAAQLRLQRADSALVIKERVAALEDIVTHLQLLFDVTALAGAIPCLSRVHSKLNEATTFMNSLREGLGMGSNAPAHEMLRRVRHLAGRPDDHMLL